jgi:hypothetical protein
MIDLRRIVIIFVIAVLLAILVNATINAIYLTPKYEDYCKQKYYPEIPRKIVEPYATCENYTAPTQAELNKCSEERGYPEYQYDVQGCVVSYTGCNFCQRDFDAATQKYNLNYFLLSSILAIIGIIAGLMLPTKNSLNEWIATGFMLGGLIALFFGTLRYYEHLGRYIKPVVILIELLIVIYISYKRLHNKVDVSK